MWTLSIEYGWYLELILLIFHWNSFSQERDSTIAIVCLFICLSISHKAKPLRLSKSCLSLDLSDLWSLRYLDSQISDLSVLWSLRSLIYWISELLDLSSMRFLLCKISDLWDIWFIRSLIYEISDLWDLSNFLDLKSGLWDFLYYLQILNISACFLPLNISSKKWK